MIRRSAAWLLALLPGALLAQEDGVVVSATRVPRPSLDVPASVDRIFGDEIREGRAQVNLSETLGRVPGIVVQNRQNYAQDLQIQSRGFGARATFGVRGLRLIADGIPMTMPDGQGQAANFSLGSAERIEVLRGPFSSLYGNAAGGVVMVQTRDGAETPQAGGSLFAGSYGMLRAGLQGGGQFGSLNVFADASHFETEGYRDHSGAKRDHFNAKLRHALSEDTSLTFVANALRQPDSQDPGGLTRAQFESNPRQVIPGVLAFDARKTVFHEQAGLTLAHRLGGGARLEAMGYFGQRWQEQFLAFGGNGVVNIDRDFGGAALRYSQPISAAANLSVGVELDRMEDRRRGFDNVSGARGALTRNEINLASSTGLYAQGEWKLSERWTAHAGVRRTQVNFENRDEFLSNGDSSGEKDYSATTPSAGLVYKINKATSVYASIGRGFETPTFLEIANRPGGAQGLNFDLAASTSRHAEAGVKTSAPGWLRLNAALFSVTTQNEIVVDQNVGGRATFKNVGRTKRRGVELAAETIGTGPWEARAAYTHLSATFADPYTTQVLNAGGQVAVPAGSMIPGVPESVLYAELRYRREPFVAQLEGLRKSRVAVNDPNTDFAAAHTVFNAMAGLVQQGTKWRFMEFVRIDNLGDRNYAGSVIVNEGNARYFEPSPRRSVFVGLQASLQL